MIFGAGKLCHTPVAYPALADMVSLIKENKGIPVIAHIGANVKTDHLNVLNEMKAVGVMAGRDRTLLMKFEQADRL